MYYVNCSNSFIDECMADIEDKSLKREDVSQEASANAASPKDHHKERTFGNKMFDMAVYPFFAFFAVAAFSIYSLYKTKFGSGKYKDFYEGCVDKANDFFGKSPIIKDKSSEKIHDTAKNATDMLISFASGTLLIAPIKFFEDKRKEVSHFFDRMHKKYWGGEKVNPEKYKPEPKQTWGSILGGRTIAFATALTTSIVLGEQIKKICAAGAIRMPWAESAKGTELDNFTKAEKWTWSTLYEGFYTALCALILYGASRVLPEMFNKKEDINKIAIDDIADKPKYSGFVNNEKSIANNVSKLGEHRNSIKPKVPLASHAAQEAARPDMYMIR